VGVEKTENMYQVAHFPPPLYPLPPGEGKQEARQTYRGDFK